MTALRIGEGFTLPLDAVTETFVILAMRGSGKTYTAAVLVEEMLDAGLPVCVVDPVGVWWGLRSSADGTSAGLPVVIFGGDHADVPLEETAGQLLADVVVDERVPAVLDLSGLSKSASRRFMTDFAERLYHRNREPLHLVLDEADAFAPQRADPGQQRLLGSIEDLVRRGRARGIGVTLITQRPAVLNKDVLTQAEVLVALRMTGVRDVAAIDEWVRLHAEEEQAREVKASLPSLPVGTAWVWSPGWLQVLQRVAVRRRRTFDSSATPKAGQRRVEPKRMAPVDLAALGERITATVERAKAEDPKQLRRRVADLERELAAEHARPRDVERVEVPVLAEDLVVQLEGVLGDLRKHGQQAVDVAQDMLDQLHNATGALQVARSTQSPDRTAPATPARPTAPQRQARPAASQGPATDATLGRGERVILTAVAQYDDGVTREQLTVLTGYKRSSRDTYLQRLKAAGYVDIHGGRLLATTDGFSALGDDFEPLPTGAALREHWLATLTGGEREILAALIDAYPAGVPRDDLSESTGYKRSSRDTYLQRLRARQLVTTDGNPRAADVLFEGSA